ncbi:hypothetical protein IG631_02440 [Alternaria alternata]|nr:hypothetical protein IG631_02440 [Alternaria alternata]
MACVCYSESQIIRAEVAESGRRRGQGSWVEKLWRRCLDKPKKDGGVACKPRFFDLLARDVVHFVPTVQKGD